jgi:hypothetical protein
MHNQNGSGKEIIWHPKQHYTRSQYRAALDDVFDSLWFEDARMRFILIGSYRMCLKPMVQYAVDKGIDEIDFIHEIRDILLEMPGCYMMER